MVKDLPIELWYEIIMYMDGKTLSKFSQISKKIYTICNDENIWKTRVATEYGTELEMIKPIDMKWKEYYVELSTNRIKNVPVTLYVSSRMIPEVYKCILVRANDTLNDLTNRILSIFMLDEVNLIWKIPTIILCTKSIHICLMIKRCSPNCMFMLVNHTSYTGPINYNDKLIDIDINDYCLWDCIEKIRLLTYN